MPDIALSSMAGGSSKPLGWIGSSFADLRAFPAPVQRVMGFALRQAQEGGKHPDAKPLRGFKSANVLEIVEDHDGSTYRAVYTVRFAEVVYVLHAFQKKAHKGRKTPPQHIEVVKQRLRATEQEYRAWKEAK